mmetsp:Transcript_12788/g.19580  ORF Transcript_12788/g.19580 Transcript_12788/m.19580 type:complete len:328 (+) Transcript_12788:153-1136(+)
MRASLQPHETLAWVRGGEDAWALLSVLGNTPEGKIKVAPPSGRRESAKNNSRVSGRPSFLAGFLDGRQGKEEAIWEVAEEDIHPFDPSHALNLEDASNLNNLHEAPLLALLRRRFRQGQIYTSTGNLLISVNPYRPIPGLYDVPLDDRADLQNDLSSKESQYDSEDEEDISGERPRAPTGLGPHVYSVAAGAWKRAAAGQDQSVVITGESGAGKTEACKQVMRRLVQINQKLTGRDFGDQIEMSLLQSNVVLEAFGNAKTLRNDNSSRFGKYVRLLYSENPNSSTQTSPVRTSLGELKLDDIGARSQPSFDSLPPQAGGGGGGGGVV